MFTITSANQPQDLLRFSELPEQRQAEARDLFARFSDCFDHEEFDQCYIDSYFIYQDHVYAIYQFKKLSWECMMPGEKWDEIYRESTTGGVLIKYVEGRRGQIVCGHYSSS